MINHVMRKENASRVFKTITPHWCSLYLLYWYKKVQILTQKALAGCCRRRGLELGPIFRASLLVSAMSSQVSDVFDIAIYIFI